jgi:hypothetical protein
MSMLSSVVQPLTLATNMGGRLARLDGGVSGFSGVGSLRFFVPAVTLTGPQFMYISRFPILLNQVHAIV